MDWEEIIKSYPTAWELFGDYVYHTIGNFNVELPEAFNSEYVNFWISDNPSGGKVTVHYRKLFDFFDGQGIRVVVVNGWKDGKMFWIFRISGKGYFIIRRSEEYSIRIEAEESAFMKAFEVLEERLRKGK
ncbi:MAG TPA: hypothetical protein VHO03_16720 [Ignavibacteriales bacterium]|nr:hypothetical protein [Ignavibacteriales bacterium]